MADAVALGMRALHLLAMAAMAGGALALALPAASRAAARWYEAAFWTALALSVLTGVANLGAYGRALPPPGSAWGTLLTVKLVLLLLGVAASLARTLLVTRAPDDAPLAPAVRAAYAATSAAAAAGAALGVAMSHA